MRFDWSPAKNDANLAKHGIDFADAAALFDGFRIEREDDRRDYGEHRFQTMGRLDGRVLFVAYTPREGGEVVWLISARKANAREVEVFEECERRAAGDAG